MLAPDTGGPSLCAFLRSPAKRRHPHPRPLPARGPQGGGEQAAISAWFAVNRPVLHVISGLRIGGAEGFLVALAGELQERGVAQHVVSLTAGGPNQARLEARGVPVTVLDPRLSSAGAARALVALIRLVRRIDPAVVQGWLYHGDLLAAAAHRLALRRGRTVLAWGLRNSDIDDGRYGLLLKMGAGLSRWPDLVVANSEAGARFHRERGYRPRRLAVIPNGIDTGRFRPDAAIRERVRRELGIAPDEVVAIHSARLDPMKDHPTLLAAASELPEVRFVLMGAGTESLSPVPPNVLALGPRERPEEICAAGDLVVSSSAFGEGFSNAIAEGMSAGLVPVATEIGDAPKLIGDTGAIVPPRDPAALARALRAIAALSPEERAARGSAARARIAERFSVARAADAFLERWAAVGSRQSAIGNRG